MPPSYPERSAAESRGFSRDDLRIPSPPSSLFVTGTDTDVGKTFVACGLAAALRERGVDVGVMKPVATGARRRRGRLVSDDAAALKAASGSADPLDEINPVRFAEPLSPHLAARRAGRTFRLSAIARRFRTLRARHDLMIVEGVGGLAVPLNSRESVGDLARILGLPLLVVARAALGTINHTLLTVAEARRRGLRLAGIVVSRGPAPRGSLAERLAPGALREATGLPVVGIVPAAAGRAPFREMISLLWPNL